MKEPRFAVKRWMDARAQEQLDSEMTSGTEEQINELSAALDQFSERYHTVQAEITNNEEAAQQAQAESLEALQRRDQILFEARQERLNETGESDTSSSALGGKNERLMTPPT